MSNFKWEVFDVEDDATAVGQHGGAVGIDNLRPVAGGTPWKVETPDASLTLPVQSGGTVVMGKKSPGEEKPGWLNRVSTDTVNFSVSFIVAIFGAAFFLVVAHGVFFGGLTLVGFMKETGLFLAGLGVGSYKKSK
jgi:hypothetical protein